MQESRDGELREFVLSTTRALVGIAARSLAGTSDDVTLAQYRVLVLLEGHGPLTMGELAANLDVNPSTITRVCDALVNKSLIVRGPAEDNRRNVRAQLAPAGRRLVDQVMAHRRELIDTVLDRMPVAAQQRVAVAFHDFAVAAGELSDDAWTLGWPIEPDGKP
jgi:DNA-binding MarR family transcriptional regulator